jgi:hypothetical protein
MLTDLYQESCLNLKWSKLCFYNVKINFGGVYVEYQFNNV